MAEAGYLSTGVHSHFPGDHSRGEGQLPPACPASNVGRRCQVWGNPITMWVHGCKSATECFTCSLEPEGASHLPRSSLFLG